MAYYDFLDFIFAPLLSLPPLLAVALMSFIVSLIIIAITKYTTNQSLMKSLKEEIKEHQSQLKQLKGNPSKALEAQKKAMEANMKYMSHSMRPTLITFIPIILIFGWMNSHFAFESIHPQQEFSITAFFGEGAGGDSEIIATDGISVLGNKTQEIEKGKATWKLKGTAEGEHLLEVAYGEEKFQTSVFVTSGKKYINQIKKTEGSATSIQINYKKLTVVPIGFRDWLGWLGTYIWGSVLFTTILRKLMKVY